MQDELAIEGKEYPSTSRGQDWLVSWHPATSPPPAGKNHGSSGVCFTPEGDIVLVTENGSDWGLPEGRPEGAEDWRQTLDREVLEEACARVLDATLLGCTKGVCIRGHEQGLVLIRSVWYARVSLDEWDPEFEMVARRILSVEEALKELAKSPFPVAIIRRFFEDALRLWERDAIQRTGPGNLV